eukprot:GHVS01010012.1.p1 GENE.GHVS01010012.1~~GHVS01010012.1.p1  ORF type:complete len:221 (+),score=33.11 GHVS01010012.1:137-799(+)
MKVLNSLKMDLVPDDDKGLKRSSSQIQRRKWDPRRKRYTMCHVDEKTGKATRVNESGKKVSGDVERSGLYERWSVRTSKRIQNVGEVEDDAQMSTKRKRAAEDEEVELMNRREEIETNPKYAELREALATNSKLTHRQQRTYKKLTTSTKLRASESSELKTHLQVTKRQKKFLKKQKTSKAGDALKKSSETRWKKKHARNVANKGAPNRSFTLVHKKAKK